MSDIIRIPLDRIVPNPKQVRKTFRRIDELARSIEQYGLLHDLVVIPHAEPGYYQIVAGERRYRALTFLSKEGRLPSAKRVAYHPPRSAASPSPAMAHSPTSSRTWCARMYRSGKSAVRTSDSTSRGSPKPKSRHGSGNRRGTFQPQ